MSFGNALLFPFPAVQYIPLPITNILTGKISASSPKTFDVRTYDVKTSIPSLIPGNALPEWRSKLLSEFHLPIPETFPQDEFPLLALNLAVHDAKYRSFFVTLLGEEKPDYFQWFSIPKSRFYKKQLYFELYDGASGKLLANYSFFKPSVKVIH